MNRYAPQPHVSAARVLGAAAVATFVGALAFTGAVRCDSHWGLWIAPFVPGVVTAAAVGSSVWDRFARPVAVVVALVAGGLVVLATWIGMFAVWVPCFE